MPKKIASSDDERVERAVVEGIVLRRCERCGQLVCESCFADGWCCQIKADRESREPTLFEVDA